MRTFFELTLIGDMYQEKYFFIFSLFNYNKMKFIVSLYNFKLFNIVKSYFTVNGKFYIQRGIRKRNKIFSTSFFPLPPF